MILLKRNVSSPQMNADKHRLLCELSVPCVSCISLFRFLCVLCEKIFVPFVVKSLPRMTRNFTKDSAEAERRLSTDERR